MIAFIKPRTPLYSTLGDVVLVLDATGLKDNTNNTYGQVTTGIVQTWKSITPGTTGAFWEWNANPVGTPGTTSTLKFQDGYVEFPGQVVLTNASSTSFFEFMSNVSPVTNLKSTAHVVLKIGQNDVPNWAYAIFGNNGTSQGSKGNAVYFEDRISLSRSDGLTSIITKGSAGFIVSGTPNDLITPNVPFVLTIETDMSQAAADRQKYYINGVQFAHVVSSPSTATSGPPTYLFDIGAAGNKVLPFRGWMSHVVIQSRIESGGVRNAFINSLLPYSRKSNSNYFYNVDESRTWAIINTLATAGRYYFVQGLLQDPTNEYNLLQVYHDGNEHLHNNDKKVAKRTSADGGRTWSAQSDAIDLDAGGTMAVQDGQWCWDSDSIIHALTDWHTSLSIGGTHTLYYSQSTNGATSFTNTDITSVIPSDGLIAFRAHGNIVNGGDGFLYGCLYKFTEEGDFTNTALYVLRKPTGSSATWTVFTVKGVNSTKHNEMSIIALDSTHLLIVCRDETTKEWHQYLGTSNGSSWTDQGAVTFGETRATVASPPLLTKFKIGLSDVIGCLVLDKESATKNVKIIYGLPANLIASGTSGWDLDTKTTVYSGTQIVHYGRILHRNNNLNSIGAWALEPTPPTLTENSLITVNHPATQFFVVKTELGL